MTERSAAGDHAVPLTIGTAEVDGATRLVLEGEVDMGTRDLFAAGMRQLVADGARSLVVDLSGVTFMDSAGLAVIAEQLGAGIDVTLLHPQRPVRRALEVSGLADRVEMVDPELDPEPTPD